MPYMIEFIGLRPKMYALHIKGKKDMKKAKSVKSNESYNVRRLHAMFE